MASPGGSDCPICRLPYAHANRTNWTACPFCNRSFGRVDGARRHTKSCPARGDRPLPPDAKRGRKVRACDACSRIKVVCDAKLPCQRCSSRSLACSYGRLCTDPAHRGDRPQPGEGLSALRFLLNSTDPRVNFVNDVMVPGEPELDPVTPAAWERPLVSSNAGNGTIDPRLLFLGFVDPYLDMTLEYGGIYDGGDVALALPAAAPDDGLTVKVHLLEKELQQLIDSQPRFRGTIDKSAFDEFFTGANFHRLLEAFFRRRQLLAKLIHWPTFDPSSVDLALLLAIALCGVAYSHTSEESRSAVPGVGTLQQLAEKYIFRRLKQCPSRDDSGLALEVCQAAYLITLLQLNVKDGDTRQKAIVKRQPALVDALRRRGMMCSRSSRNTPGTPADWYAFVRRESWIRLVTWVLFTEGLLALFCNSPPATTVLEMSYDLPCRDQLWDADSASSFEAESKRDEPLLPSLGMKDVLAALLADEWSEATAAVYERLSVFDLYTAIGAFQLVLFNYKTSMLPKRFGSILLRALRRWDHLWAVAMSRVAPMQQRWLGVVKYSPEFALVSKRIIEVSSTEEGKCSKYLQCAIEYDFRAFHEFLLRHGSSGRDTVA